MYQGGRVNRKVVESEHKHFNDQLRSSVSMLSVTYHFSVSSTFFNIFAANDDSISASMLLYFSRIVIKMRTIDARMKYNFCLPLCFNLHFLHSLYACDFHHDFPSEVVFCGEYVTKGRGLSWWNARPMILSHTMHAEVIPCRIFPCIFRSRIACSRLPSLYCALMRWHLECCKSVYRPFLFLQ